MTTLAPPETDEAFGPEYGPTETEWWFKCPTYRWFRAKGWQPRGTLWTPNMLVGRALHAGIATYFISGQNAAMAATATEKVLSDGYETNDEWTLEALNRLTLRGLVASLNTTVKGWLETETFVGAEVTVGSGRIDLVTKGSEGLVVTDTKSTMQLKAEWVAPRLSESEVDWQLWDSAWRAWRYYEQAVAWRRRHLIVLSPQCKAFQHPSPVKYEGLVAWRKTALWAWQQMEKEEAGPVSEVPQRLSACIHPRFGKCEMYDACHVLFRNEKAMQGLYEKTT
jgi:hypothetical protein